MITLAKTSESILIDGVQYAKNAFNVSYYDEEELFSLSLVTPVNNPFMNPLKAPTSFSQVINGDTGSPFVSYASFKTWISTNLFVSPGDGNTTPVEVVVYKLKTILSDAQIKTLPAIPVELVPPPGDGKFIVFHNAIFYKPAFTANYGNISDNGSINVGYLGGTSVDVGFWTDISASVEAVSSLLVNNASWGNTATFQDGPSVAVIGSYYLPMTLRSGNNLIINRSLNLFCYNADGDFTGGHVDNTIEVTVFYSIVDL